MAGENNQRVFMNSPSKSCSKITSVNRVKISSV